MITDPHEFDEFDNTFDELNDDDGAIGFGEFEEEFPSDGYDDAELERRRVAYADLKKNDKIFNNTYNMGLESTDEDDSDQPSSRSEIKIDSGSAEYNMYDPLKYSEHVDLSIVHRDVHAFIQNCDEVLEILGDEPDKKKFVKAEINQLFEILVNRLTKGADVNVFINSIHILDAISSLTNMEYKKLFDMMSYDNKEVLLLELNTKYGFLDSTGRDRKSVV